MYLEKKKTNRQPSFQSGNIAVLLDNVKNKGDTIKLQSFKGRSACCDFWTDYILFTFYESFGSRGQVS